MEYVFFGKVIPSFKKVSFNIKNPPLKLPVGSIIGKFNYTLLLNNTDDIVVVIESETEIKDVSTLVNLIKSYTQSFYDTALLTTGVLCSVNFTSAYLPDKSLAQVNIQDFSSWLRKDIFKFGIELLFRQMIENSVIRIAIADIKYACNEPDLTAFFSYRAIEGIMNSFQTDESDKPIDNWNRLRENLNISRNFFDYVEELSKKNRHGKILIQAFSDRKLCIYSALLVLERYMQYINLDRNKLREGEFRVLQKDDLETYCRDSGSIHSA